VVEPKGGVQFFPETKSKQFDPSHVLATLFLRSRLAGMKLGVSDCIKEDSTVHNEKCYQCYHHGGAWILLLK